MHEMCHGRRQGLASWQPTFGGGRSAHGVVWRAGVERLDGGSREPSGRKGASIAKFAAMGAGCKASLKRSGVVR